MHIASATAKLTALERRMREEAAANGQPVDNDRDAAFSSFNQRGGSSRGGGYRQDDAAYGSFTNNSGGGRRRNNSRDGYDQSGVDFSAFGGGRSRRRSRRPGATKAATSSRGTCTAMS